MTDAIFDLALIFCAIAAVYFAGCLFASLFDVWRIISTTRRPMATQIRGRHYQDIDHKGNNTP